MAGEKLNTLQIPFPDFRVADIIEPEEFDANNKALQDKLNAIVSTLNAYVLAVANNEPGNSYYTKQEVASLMAIGMGRTVYLDGGSFHDMYTGFASVDGGSFDEELSETLVYDGGVF